MTDPDHAFLTGVQKDSFAYFVHEVNEANGLVADKTAHNWPASIAAVGMALAVYAIGAERGFMARGRAAQRTARSPRCGSLPTANKAGRPAPPVTRVSITISSTWKPASPPGTANCRASIPHC
jgi:hypothetical protein